MKYLSPSPTIESSLPTPPHSPHSSHTEVVVHKATTMLDSLCSFYQQERYWVHHTRASLELAITKGVDAHAITCSSSAASSPASSTSTLCDSPMQHTITVKPDPEAENIAAAAALLSSSPPPPPSSDTPMTQAEKDAARTSRWLRRKNQMRLRLDGINSHPHRNATSTNGWKRQQRPHRAPPSEPGARLLEMFSELVDSRMESCQRISRMVQESAGRQQMCCC